MMCSKSALIEGGSVGKKKIPDWEKDMYGPYAQDIPKLKELGLKEWKTEDTYQKSKMYIGLTHPFEGATVEVYVTCLPAQFWEFHVNSTEDESTVLTTGSGCLDDFWPTVLLFASGMMGAKDDSQDTMGEDQ
jgi:hypothetical protein